MKPPSLRIAIVGCGTAGPAAAVLLKRLGHEVVLFERADECKAVGAGFLLQPSGMVVLKELGILDEVLAHAAKVDRLHVLDSTGDTLLDLRYGEIGKGSFGAGLHRPVLLHHLIAAMNEAEVDVRWGWEIEDASKSDGRWILKSTDGNKCSGFDLLIVADGARSKLRDLAGTGGVNRGYPWGAHWFIGKNDGVFPENELYQVVHGTRRLGGFLATGRDLDGGDPLVSLFWSIKIGDDAAWRARPIEEWKRQILDICPKSAGLLDQITGWDQVLTARYGDVRMRRWYGEGIVVLGDAAHAMSPQLGQGVNLALADASCLADCLARHPLPEALVLYQRRRRLALRYYQFATRWLTPWFQSDHEWLSPIRRVFFGISRRIPLARLLMTLSMAGLVGTGRCSSEK
ncbi:MAG: NAD(P)/FAD-dependent oxidoreductase [Luteolibacter sp.]|uniref:FAD-dependent oxidoreductase n=1 Tax=Luteolibacter sp. TaxID=1962973 RepID=UPI003264D019